MSEDLLNTYPLSGWFEGNVHYLPIRIYYEDTDTAGIVYYANYARFFERGRSEYLRLKNISHTELANGKYGEAMSFAVSEVNLKYKRPAKIDDILLIETRFTNMGPVRFQLQQVAYLSNDEMQKGNILNEALVTIALIDDRGRPKRCPQDLVNCLELEV